MSRALPILFNTEMVRAILDGRKDATRRIVKGFIPDDAVWGYTAFTPKGYISCRVTFADGYGEKFFKLPCEPGDSLYVRETWEHFECRLVETAGHIIITYLLARQAGEAEEYAASARVFCKLAEAKIAEAYTYVMNSTTEDVALFKAVENEV